MNVSSALQVVAGQVTLPFVFSARITKNVLLEMFWRLGFRAGMESSTENCDAGGVKSTCHPLQPPRGAWTSSSTWSCSVGVWDKAFPVGRGKLKSRKLLLSSAHKGKGPGSSPLPGAPAAFHASETFGNQFLLWLIAVSESQEGKGPSNPNQSRRSHTSPALQGALGWPNSRRAEGDGEAAAFHEGVSAPSHTQRPLWAS